MSAHVRVEGFHQALGRGLSRPPSVLSRLRLPPSVGGATSREVEHIGLLGGNAFECVDELAAPDALDEAAMVPFELLAQRGP